MHSIYVLSYDHSLAAASSQSRAHEVAEARSHRRGLPSPLQQHRAHRTRSHLQRAPQHPRPMGQAHGRWEAPVPGDSPGAVSHITQHMQETSKTSGSSSTKSIYFFKPTPIKPRVSLGWFHCQTSGLRWCPPGMVQLLQLTLILPIPDSHLELLPLGMHSTDCTQSS